MSEERTCSTPASKSGEEIFASGRAAGRHEVESETEILFWSIVDRDGLTGLPSDMWAALDILVTRAALSPPDAGEVRTYREGIEMACKAFEQAIDEGYPSSPPSRGAKCEHGQYYYEDCIGCYDEALTASIAAIRKLP